MADTPDTPDGEEDTCPLEIRPHADGHVLVFDGLIIGELGEIADVQGVRGPTVLALDAGWLRLAGVTFWLRDDPRLDNHRDGYIIQR